MDRKISKFQRLMLIGGMLLLSGCSTKPRYFVPQLASPPPAIEFLDRDTYICDQLVRKGFKGGFKNAALQVGGGTAAAVGAGVAAAALTSTTVAAGSGLGTAINAAVAPAANAAAAFTIILPVAMFATSRIIRSSREKKHKRLMGECLTELGYAPESWIKAKRPKKDATFIASPAVTPVDAAVPPLEIPETTKTGEAPPEGF
jgi:hypothetical protein